MLKHCRWCGETKPLGQFHRHSQMKDGHLNKCAACVRAYVREHRRRNPLRKVWQHMVDRCRRPSHRYWHRYGGRGIKVCSRWSVYENFLADMGPSFKSGLQLDRVDNDGDYEPSNCHWVTASANVRNSTTATKVAAFGKEQSLVQWAEETGIAASTISARLRTSGWSPERAVSAPVMSPSESARESRQG